MFEQIIIVTLIILLIFAIRAIIILYNKYTFYERWIIKFKEKVNFTYNSIKEIDIHGSFEADDETGIIFESIKTLIEDLNKFIDVDDKYLEIYQQDTEKVNL